MRFKAILALVNEKYQDDVIESAKTAGATGVTILNARGEGIHTQKSFLGLTMESQRICSFFWLKILFPIILWKQFIAPGI